MLTLSIDLDTTSAGVVTDRSVTAGTVFPVAVMAEDDGQAPTPSEFDTIIVELLFNDGDAVLNVDPVQRPVAGDLAAESGATGVDAFARHPLTVVRVADISVAGPEVKAPAGAELTLRLPHDGDRHGAYRNSTGRAGLYAQEGTFTLEAGVQKTVAMGKVRAGIEAVKAGTSHIVPVGTALHGNEPVPIRSVVGTVTVA